MDSPTAAVAEEVRVQLVRKRISQNAAADHLGISKSSMSRRLNGEYDFTVGELYRLADLFGIDPAALLPATDRAVPA